MDKQDKPAQKVVMGKLRWVDITEHTILNHLLLIMLLIFCHNFIKRVVHDHRKIGILNRK